MTITFIRSRHETAGALDAYEVTIPTTTHIVVPHFHRHYDETIFGVDGVTTWTVDGVITEVGPGQQLFIARGSHHTYANLHLRTARMICLTTPGLLGPEYFQELAFAMEEHGRKDSAAVELVMSRYGVIPANLSGVQIAPPASPSLNQRRVLQQTHRGLGAN